MVTSGASSEAGATFEKRPVNSGLFQQLCGGVFIRYKVVGSKAGGQSDEVAYLSGIEYHGFWGKLFAFKSI